ncbi:ThiF family adenylyltransferase [Bradyrhizobium sp. 166]|nr:ThiF family adenylyltransferase [Bradyrhizobium sp. 166]MCK1606500.1 ThiF family adenylyltransferase [Bradyrhizobium sp. 166]
MRVSLTITSDQHRSLMEHLFPQDGCEAVAIALCGRRSGTESHRLLVQSIFLVPHDACSVRTPDRVTWPTEVLLPLLEQAAARGLALIKIHGHRGYDQFSSIDDISDRALFPSVYSWVDATEPHASVIVLDSGRMFGRVVSNVGEFTDLACINLVGDDLQFWYPNEIGGKTPEYGTRIAQAFGERTYDCLSRLRIAVVGCSGTGSHVIEQLARNCVGELVLVDPDVVEEKNLNRILNSGMADAEAGRSKVAVAEDAIKKMRLGTRVKVFRENLFSADVIKAVAECDIVFGCVDTVDARHLLNKLCSFYLVPYFDLGVRLDADGNGGVDQVCGTVHYLQPGGSSLFSRGVYSMEQLRAAGLFRTNPSAYRTQLDEGYIKGIPENRPAVVQVNGLIASLAINELLARLHPYRLDPNGEFAVHRISLSHAIYEHETGGDSCTMMSRHIGRGDTDPLLDWAELSSTREAA